jgi:hypothetical protein
MFDLATTCRAITPFFAKKRYPICDETVSEPPLFAMKRYPICDETVSDLR